MNNQIPQLDNTPGNPATDSVLTVSDPKPTRATVGDDRNAAIAAGNIIGTARTLEGTPLAPSQITEKSIVSVVVEGKSMEMTALQAEQFGFLKKTADGWKTPDGQQATPPEPPQAIEQPDQPELFRAEQEQEYTNITTGIPPALHNRMITDWIKGGEVSEESLRAAANEIPGADLDVIRERVNRTLELFSDQAHASITAQGLNSESVLVWADKHHPDVLNQAMELQAKSRTTKGFEKVTKLYLQSLDEIAPKQILAMKFPDGVTVSKGLDGKITVNFRGGTCSWKQAVKHGVVKFKGNK